MKDAVNALKWIIKSNMKIEKIFFFSKIRCLFEQDFQQDVGPENDFFFNQHFPRIQGVNTLNRKKSPNVEE
jgi:hypothetical protein